MLASYIPLAICLVVGVGFGLLLLLLAWGLGPKRESAEKALPYECGRDPAGTPRTRFSVRFYRVAILFLVFDIESAFLYPWAVLYRELSCKPSSAFKGGVCSGSPTPYGLLLMLVFLAILVLALIYVWRRKALEWD